MNLTDINYIRQLLSNNGFHFSRAMGQNFLTAAWVPEQIAESACIDAGTAVLEVGPGIGCLTVQLAERAGKVLCVELDRRLEPVLRETVGAMDNVKVVFCDALKSDLETLADEHMPGMRRVICANVPYNITSPLLSAFIEAKSFETVTVMVQREVAQRICARPGSSDYGAFTVYVNWYMEPEKLFDVSPGCFVPQPKVTSSVVRMKRRTVPPAPVSNEKLLFKTVRAAFGQRRKTLLNALSGNFGQISREQLADIMESCGIDPGIRGETLEMHQFAALTCKLDEYNVKMG